MKGDGYATGITVKITNLQAARTLVRFDVDANHPQRGIHVALTPKKAQKLAMRLLILADELESGE